MKGIPKITLEPANIVCPKCGNPNYMRHRVGEGVGKLDMKCINCNSYFNFDELYKHKIAEVIKPKQTNADRIRAMTDEELGSVLFGALSANICPNGCDNCDGDCDRHTMDWLKQPYKEDK